MSGFGIRSARLTVCVLAAVLAWSATHGVCSAEGAGRREHSPVRAVVTYLTRGPNGEASELRVFDPENQTDQRLLAPGSGASAFYWNSAGTRLSFACDGAVQGMDWAYGSEPWPLIRLPGVLVLDWWRNPVRRCWQVAAGGGVPGRMKPGDPRTALCHHELWESDSLGANWTVVRSETTDCRGFYYPGWLLADNSRIQREEVRGLTSTFEAMRVGGAERKPEYARGPSCELPWADDWFAVPLDSLDHHALLGRAHRDSRGPFAMVAPLYLWNRELGTFRLLDTGSARDRLIFPLYAEAVGPYLLVSGDFTAIFDMRSGARIAELKRVSHAIWTPRPARRRANPIGQRRLRVWWRG